jgi:minor histocompatibility antigen H13
LYICIYIYLHIFNFYHLYLISKFVFFFQYLGQFSLLGLGDIVIPGLFVALLLRFDAVRNKISAVNADHASFSKSYFLVNLFCYALGLVITVGVMYFFNAAQPALLYLVPACLGGSLTIALMRGEINLLFAYDEDTKDKDITAKAGEEAKKGK